MVLRLEQTLLQLVVGLSSLFVVRLELGRMLQSVGIPIQLGTFVGSGLALRLELWLGRSEARQLASFSTRTGTASAASEAEYS